MRYAEIKNGKVTFVLPASLAAAYTILPPSGVSIAAESDVVPGWIFDGKTFRAPTKEDIAAEYRPVFNAERARLFAATEWVRERHNDRLAMNMNDAENWTSWLAYWQALRDLPQTEGFDARNPAWPEMPK